MIFGRFTNKKTKTTHLESETFRQARCFNPTVLDSSPGYMIALSSGILD